MRRLTNREVIVRTAITFATIVTFLGPLGASAGGRVQTPPQETTAIDSIEDATATLGEALAEQLADFDFDTKVLVAPSFDPRAETLHLVHVSEGGHETYMVTPELSLIVTREDGEVRVEHKDVLPPCASGAAPDPEEHRRCQEDANNRRNRMRRTAVVFSLDRDGLGTITEVENKLTSFPPSVAR